MIVEMEFKNYNLKQLVVEMKNLGRPLSNFLSMTSPLPTIKILDLKNMQEEMKNQQVLFKPEKKIQQQKQ